MLSQHLQPGDLLIDGGNEWFPNTLRRAKELEPKGKFVYFLAEFCSWEWESQGEKKVPEMDHP